MTTQVRNAAMVNLLSADFQRRYEPQFALAQVMSNMMALPGLRGFWPMSAFDESGNAFDQSGNGRTLTYNGNPTYNYDDLAPYIALDGTGDYLSRADEAGLDIIGTETFVASGTQGLTLGGWFWLDSLAGASFERLMAKDDGVNRSFSIYFSESTDTLSFEIHVTTPATRTVSSGAVSAAQTWFFVVGRFVSGSEQSIFLNGTETVAARTDTAINNSTAAFEIGRLGSGAQLFTGRASLCFLCASALSDAIIGNLWQQSRALFGV